MGLLDFVTFCQKTHTYRQTDRQADRHRHVYEIEFVLATFLFDDGFALSKNYFTIEFLWETEVLYGWRKIRRRNHNFPHI